MREILRRHVFEIVSNYVQKKEKEVFRFEHVYRVPFELFWKGLWELTLLRFSVADRLLRREARWRLYQYRRNRILSNRLYKRG